MLPPASGADAALSSTSNQTILDNLCYQYRYDQLGRMSAKKIPGKGWEYTVYNVLDQPVATQDSLQRAAKEWLFTKYDALGRILITGIWTNGSTPTAISQPALQAILTGYTTNLWETPITTGTGYTSVAWPTTYTIPLTINYYDNYIGIPSLPATYSAPATASTQTLGLVTATKVAVLNNPANMLLSVLYYDDLGRLLKVYKQHYLGGMLNNGNYDATTSTYDFTNALTTTSRQHFTAASSTTPLVTVANTIIYDQVGRKLKNWEQITNGTATTTKTLISQVVYNEIGQAMNKELHSTDSTTFLQNIAYAYNERGWLLQSNSSMFQMQLEYNTGTNKLYNGNIAYQLWITQGGTAKTFTYAYDSLNRLTSGSSSDNNAERGISYDMMGNISHLSRLVNNILVDSLTYTYVSGTNKLQTIVDKTSNNVGLNAGTMNYIFDANGNLLSNTNSATSSQNKTFTYNLLNLSQVITVSGGTITYTYDATGRKLRKVSVLSGITNSTDYIDGIQYYNSTTTISLIQTEEGKAVPITGGYDYYYYLSDHLGNTRVTFDTESGAAIVQQEDYLPFGMSINEVVPPVKNEYLYNKKELQEELTEYDYGARFYDQVIGRWNTIDPLAETGRRFTPYNYVVDNPIRNTDPDGMDYVDDVMAQQPEELRTSDLVARLVGGVSDGSNNDGAGNGDNGGGSDNSTTTDPPESSSQPGGSVKPESSDSNSEAGDVHVGRNGKTLPQSPAKFVQFGGMCVFRTISNVAAFYNKNLGDFEMAYTFAKSKLGKNASQQDLANYAEYHGVDNGDLGDLLSTYFTGGFVPPFASCMQRQIDDNNPIMAFLLEGRDEKGVLVGHEVMITGYSTKGLEFNYFDPQLGTYRNALVNQFFMPFAITGVK